MADVIRGLLGTGNTDAELRIRSILKTPSQQEPANTALLAVTRRLRQKGRKGNFTAKGYLFEWLNQARFLRFVTVGTSAPGTGTTINLTDPSSIEAGRMILEYGDEMIMVTAVNLSTGDLTVIRDIADTGIESIPAGAV